jgi:SAM-dependent methyltransferase
LLNNDTVVTPRWLEQLTACLESDERIGAAGPVTNAASYYSAIPVPYTTLEQMEAFAESYNRKDPSKWMERLKLVGYCLIMKREVYRQVGPLDERFTPGNFEDDDYSLRIRKAGWRLVLCGDTFIHHENGRTFRQDPAAYVELLKRNAVKFADKWGFDPAYALHIRFDLLSLMEEPPEAPLRVLEIGCACGATLLEIRNRWPNARVYGMELHAPSAEVASLVAEVEVGDAEAEDWKYPEKSMDYILFGDVLEHMKEPWNVLVKARRFLKDNGKVLASIPNVGHHSVIRELLEGKWTYTSRGLLDITHLRFFTLESIKRLFAGCGFPYMLIRPVELVPSAEDENWLNRLAGFFGEEHRPSWTAYQYLVRASRHPELPGSHDQGREASSG